MNKTVVITTGVALVGVAGFFYWKSKKAKSDAAATAEQLTASQKETAAAEQQAALAQKAKNDALKAKAATDKAAADALAAAKSDDNIAGAYVYTNATTPLRAENYASSTIITYLAKGMKIRVIQPYKDMYQVYYNSAQLGGVQRKGWVLKNQVTLI